MIKVTVELISANDGHTETLGEAIIYNDGRGTPTVGHYGAIFSKRGGFGKRMTRVWKRTRIEGFPRKRLLAWDLLCRALNETIGDRNV